MKVQTIISKAEEILNTNNNREIIYNFLEQYIKCEMICKSIVKMYLDNIGEEYEEDTMPFSLRDINNAISNCNITFEDKKILTRIWGKSDKKGEKAIRILRNKLVHELKESALIEIVERNDEIMEDLTSFKQCILDYYKK